MRAACLCVLAACSVSDKHLVTADSGDDANPDAAAPGSYVWIRSMSTMGTFGVAVGAGGLVVVGDLTVPADLGGGQLTPANGVDMVIAGFTETDASHVYSVRYGATGNEFPFLDVTDANGAPIVYGLTGGTPYDVGEGNTMSDGGADGYIGRYGPGAPGWVQRIHGALDDKMITSTRGAGSTVYGAGWFEGTMMLGADTYVAKAGRDIFVARFNTFTGKSDLARAYGTTNREESSGSAPVAGGGLVLTGMFDNAIDINDKLSFGGAATPLTSAGGLDTYVAKLDTSGNGVWAVHLGGAGDERDGRVATDANGDVYITGTFSGTVMFGATQLASNGAADIYVAKLRGDDGGVVWATSFGGTGDDGERGISVDAKGHVVVTGWVVGALDGGQTLGGADAVIAEYDAANGMLKWRKVFSTAGDDRGWSNTFGTSGDILATVNMGGTYDFGFPITGPAAPASVVLRITP